VIDGGETGPNARPSHPDWFRQIRDECVEANIPYFHKHNGRWTVAASSIFRSTRFAEVNGTRMGYVGKKKAGHLLDGKEWRQMPD